MKHFSAYGTLCDALNQTPLPPAGSGENLFLPEEGRLPHQAGLAEVGLKRVIDAHSHWFPGNVEAKIWQYFDAHYWPVVYRGSYAQRLEWVRHYQLRAFTTLVYAHRRGMADWLNQWVYGFSQANPLAIPCGTFYPEPLAAETVRRCIEDFRFRGFKLHVGVGQFNPNDALLFEAFAQIEAAGLPVVMHIGSAPEKGTYAAPHFLRQLLEVHPGLKVIVAHMGANEYEAYLELAEQKETVYLDTTMIFVDFKLGRTFPEALYGRLADLGDKILFGSDFPTIPYPLSHCLEKILALPFSAEWKRKVLAENAARLFGVSAAGVESSLV